MKFITHNQCTIDFNTIYTATFVGQIKASPIQLCSLFGKHHLEEYEKHESLSWRIKFEDGSVANIYSGLDNLEYHETRAFGVRCNPPTCFKNLIKIVLDKFAKLSSPQYMRSLEYRKSKDTTNNNIKFITHTAGKIDVSGVKFTGKIKASHNQLCHLFGKPCDEKDYPMWIIKFDDGSVATIRNHYKDGFETHDIRFFIVRCHPRECFTKIEKVVLDGFTRLNSPLDMRTRIPNWSHRFSHKTLH